MFANIERACLKYVERKLDKATFSSKRAITPDFADAGTAENTRNYLTAWLGTDMQPVMKKTASNILVKAGFNVPTLDWDWSKSAETIKSQIKSEVNGIPKSESYCLDFSKIPRDLNSNKISEILTVLKVGTVLFASMLSIIFSNRQRKKIFT